MKVLFVPEKTDDANQSDEENLKQVALKTATPEQVTSLIDVWNENQAKYIPLERETHAEVSEETKDKEKVIFEIFPFLETPRTGD